jgi:hypothetical protein
MNEPFSHNSKVVVVPNVTVPLATAVGVTTTAVAGVTAFLLPAALVVVVTATDPALAL